MNLFIWNLLLAVVWAMATAQLTLGNILVGFLLGYFVLLFTQWPLESGSYFTRVPRVVKFAVFYLEQLLLSNLRVAFDVVTPRHYMQPAVIAVPLDAKTDAEITLLANLITLTPGTLSLDLSEDRRVLYVHMMYVDDKDAERASRQIKEGLERRVLEILR